MSVHPLNEVMRLHSICYNDIDNEITQIQLPSEIITKSYLKITSF